MTPEKEAELFAKVDRLQDGLNKLFELVSRQTAEISDMRGDFKAVNARLDEQRAWLQSTDQRFTAIMTPYQQKHS